MKCTSTSISKTLFRTLIYLAICFSFLTACGKQGPPKPKQYDRPEELTVRVQQEGYRVKLNLPYPQKRSSGKDLKHFSSVEIYLLALPVSKPDIPKPPPLNTLITPKNLRWELDPELCTPYFNQNQLIIPMQMDETLSDSPYAVLFISALVRDDKGKTSKPAPMVSFLSRIPPPPPNEVKADPVAAGVKLTWVAESCSRVIVRRMDGAILDSGIVNVEGGYLDMTVTHDSTYTYSVYCASDDESVISQPGSVTIHYQDLIPPESVTNLRLSPLNEKIRLSWDSSPGSSLYRIYTECEGDTAGTLITETQETFVLINPTKCVLAVTALDSAGNESQPVRVSADHE